MSYTSTEGVDPTKPVGSTTPANTIDTEIQNVKRDYNERLNDVLGVTWATDDPVRPTKLGPSVNIQSSQIQASVYSAGNSSTAITIDWNNGINQKVTLTGNCTFTFSNPVEGTDYRLILTQDGTGSRSVSFPATVRWTNNSSAPTLDSTASRTSIILLSYFNSRYLAGVYGTGYNVS